MRISKTAIGVGLAAALASAVAFAGFRVNWEVGVDTVSRNAWGSLGSARNSADGVQYIGCSVAVFTYGTPSVYCSARNAAGTSVACASTDAAIVAQAQSIKGDSYLFFVWDEAGYCNYLYVDNVSHVAPKAQ